MLTEWLSEDALRFDLFSKPRKPMIRLLKNERCCNRSSKSRLPVESFSSSVVMRPRSMRDYSALAERYECRLLSCKRASADPEADHLSDYLTISGPQPLIQLDGEKSFDDTNDPAESWRSALARLVSNWLQQRL